MNAVYTIVFNDMVILELWLKYYSRWFDHLVVIGSGTKDMYKGEIKLLQKRYGFEFAPIPFNDSIGELLTMVKDKQVELLKDHKWVLYTNCDEYLITDPKRYKDLKELMNKTWKKYVHCEAFDVYQADDEDPIDYSKPYLKQRKYWFKNKSYNKVILSRVELDWSNGCHRPNFITSEESRELKNVGLYLVHLKYSDPNAAGRDFGPYETTMEGDLLSKGMELKTLIPEELKEVF